MGNLLSKSNIRKIWIIALAFTLLISCGDNDTSYIPDVPVYLELNIITDLNNIGTGQMVTITPDKSNDGSLVNFPGTKVFRRIFYKSYGKGIVLYRKEFYNYVAYDITCTYKAFSDNCAIGFTDSDDMLPKCPCCNSVFMLNSDGIPSSSSKASHPLVPYQVRLTDNGTRLVIEKYAQ